MLHSIFGFMIVIAIICLIQSQYERNQLVVEEEMIVSKKIKENKTLVFLSDLHDKEFGINNSRLLEKIATIKPDMILIGGDTMVMKHGKESLEVTRKLIANLVSIAPVFYGNGNHEQRLEGSLKEEFLQILKEHGVTYLSDTSCEIGNDMVISGLNIIEYYYTHVRTEPMEPSYLKEHIGEVSKEKFQLLLAHSPLFFETYVAWGADLTLSGHFHGGTIRIPKLGGLMTPQIQFFCPYCAGKFEKDKKQLIVSRGLGTHSINIRLGNKPQILAIHLQSR